MVVPNQALTLDPTYRIEKDRLFFIWVFFAFVAVVARVTDFAPLAFALIPIGLVFVRLNTYRFLVLLIAGYTLFFRPGTPGSVSHGIFIADALTVSFLFLLLLSASRESGRKPRIPFSPTLAMLYLFVAYVLVLVPLSLYSRFALSYVIYDVKNVLYLLMVPLLLMVDGRSREPKKFFLLLGAFVLFCAVHSLELIGEFLIVQERGITWNEIYISDAVIISLLMLRFPVRAGTRWLLRIALGLSGLGLLITQTRGLWLSTVVALGVFYVLDLFLGRNFQPARILKGAAISLGVFALANVAFLAVAGTSMVGFVKNRFGQGSSTELIDPYSSMGYRLHEAMTVWADRSWFGHGPGATLHVFFTQLGKSKFIEWWSIHSGYFEFLHKFGFVGLALILVMFLSYYFLGMRLARSPSRTVSAFGAILATVILNHMVVSITSGYLFRHGVIIWVPLFLIAERLRRRSAAPSAPAA
jgi:O-antigen ligase